MAENTDIGSLSIDGKPLKNLEESLRISLDKVKDGTLSPSDSLGKCSLSEYWTKLGYFIQAFCKENTKLSVAFLKLPLPSPKETQALVDGAELVIIAVLSTYSAFNLKEGISMHSALKTFVLDLLKSMLDFVSSLNKENKKEALRLVGIVWECCESFKTIPKNAKETVLLDAKSSLELISDALVEAEEFCSERSESKSCDPKDVNTVPDKTDKIMHSSMGLAKVVKSLIKKIIKAITKNGQTDDINKVKELNTVSEVIQLLSPRVDEVFCCLYSSSLADSSVVTEGMALASPVEKLIQLCRNSHFCLEEDKSWLDFLTKALHHNLDNLKAQHDA